MNKTLFLGIDTSTTASKVLLIDKAGQVVAVASSPHTLQAPHPLWSEQEPEDLFYRIPPLDRGTEAQEQNV